jgi:multiple antibiotic resistance protein
MDDLPRVFVAFLAIVDPLGNVLVFHLLTAHLTAAERLRVAAVAVLAAGALLTAFALGGLEVLAFLGISAESFRVAAGLLLLLPAYRLVAEGQPLDAVQREIATPIEIALVPLAMPLLAGPGALATTITFADTRGAGPTILAFSVVLGLSFVAFAAAGRLLAWLGAAGLRLLSRLVGVLLVAIAVELILAGLRAYFGPG